MRDVQRFADFGSIYAEDMKRAMSAHWPGPVTLVVPAKDTVPHSVTGGADTVALRLPSEPYMREYLNAWGGPLVSTSLNISGQAPVRRAEKIPSGPMALKLKKPLKGESSRIYNVVTGFWER